MLYDVEAPLAHERVTVVDAVIGRKLRPVPGESRRGTLLSSDDDAVHVDDVASMLIGKLECEEVAHRAAALDPVALPVHGDRDRREPRQAHGGHEQRRQGDRQVQARPALARSVCHVVVTHAPTS